MLTKRFSSQRLNKSSGFTIVELLIVIVIIGILAALVVIAYNGLQTRARDSTRVTDMRNIKTAIESYYADNGTYPPNPVAYRVSSMASLVPKYIKQAPTDPINAAQDGKAYIYYYIIGYKKTGPTTYINTGSTNDYMMSMSLESSSGPQYTGYGAPGNLNWLDGN
jgi:prepilin-type N-terminal cleavage/methylation domain-containing protein